MEIFEIEGKTIDEAIEKACREFNVAREKLNIEIISEGSAGFLGLGGKRAKIRAGIMSLDAELNASSIEQAHEQPKKIIRKTLSDESIAGKFVKTEDSSESIAVRAKIFLEGILSRMNISCSVMFEETSELVVLNIQGDGSGLLIGKRGQNLDAIQYIVNRAVSKSGNASKMIVIDTEEYRKRRKDSLVSLAEKIGEKVKKTKKAVTLSYMNAHDRRIVHLTLQDEKLLTTKSRGEGEYRKIVIMPAKRDYGDT
jgi:spoIIIJ-associated protein